MTLWQYLRDARKGLDVHVFDRQDDRLGRHQVHNPKARLYDARRGVGWDPMPQTHVRHVRHAPVWNQGDIGACTANGALGVMCTGPFWRPPTGATTLAPLTGRPGVTPYLEADCYQLYREETRLDDSLIPGHWEPQDTGSTGDWSMAALRARGLIKAWQHTFRWQDTVRLLAKQPISVGVPWYESMFEPDAKGMVRIAGQVAGGHQFVVDELIPVFDTNGRGQVVDYILGATNSWDTSWGLEGRFLIPGPVGRRLLAEGGDVVSPKLP